MEMKFNSQICTTREQSERLLSLGLKKETADCVWIEMSKDDWRVDANGWKEYHSIIEEGFFPAWSLHRLMCLVFNSGVTCVELHEDDDVYETLIYNIAWRIKEGYFNKEYLV